MDGYELVMHELETHATDVDGLIDRLNTAVDAANTVTMNNSAYGVVCQPFAMLLQPFEQLGVNTLKKAVETLGDTAGKVRDTAKSYGTTDTAHAASFTGIEGTL
jgi:Excreted virulence factor EspC, type VII ESX diderm